MKNVLTSFALLFSLILSSQNFEGLIVYKNSCKSKIPNYTDQQWIDMIGSKQQYFISNGNYKSLSNGTMTQWQMYVKADNKLYTKMSNSETVLWNDAAVNQDEVLKTEINKNVVTILGYQCDELILTCKSGVQKYYFSSKLAVNPADFANHLYGNWYAYISKAKAMSLKMIIETPQFIMETVALEVQAKKIEPSFFSLPAGTKTSKSPY